MARKTASAAGEGGRDPAAESARASAGKTAEDAAGDSNRSKRRASARAAGSKPQKRKSPDDKSAEQKTTGSASSGAESQKKAPRKKAWEEETSQEKVRKEKAAQDKAPDEKATGKNSPDDEASGDGTAGKAATARRSGTRRARGATGGGAEASAKGARASTRSSSRGTRPAGALASLRREVRLLYEGRSRRARAFRYGLLAFDMVTIGYFLVVSFIHSAPWMRIADLAFALIIALDFAARLWIAENRARFLRQLPTLADIVVIVSLTGTFIFENLAYLRILRALRLMRSYHMLNALRDISPAFRRNEHVFIAATNLLVFVFVVSALVYTLQAPVNPAITNYIDALYFTVTTLTTTGFGDIVLTGTGGRLLAVGIMVFGAALFLRLAQAIFRPPKVRYRCPQCGLMEHDPDASHCKHCGHVINIPTEGF
jgi:voltage-gated potassium channel